VPKGRGARCHELTIPNVDEPFYRDIEAAAGAQPHDRSFIAEAKAALIEEHPRPPLSEPLAALQVGDTVFINDAAFVAGRTWERQAKLTVHTQYGTGRYIHEALFALLSTHMPANINDRDCNYTTPPPPAPPRYTTGTALHHNIPRFASYKVADM
jgi:hypothetical protein